MVERHAKLSLQADRYKTHMADVADALESTDTSPCEYGTCMGRAREHAVLSFLCNGLLTVCACSVYGTNKVEIG